MSEILKEFFPHQDYLCKYLQRNYRDDSDDTIITNSVIHIHYSDNDTVEIKINEEEKISDVIKQSEKVPEEEQPLLEPVKIITEDDYNKYKELFDKFEKGYNILSNVKSWFLKIFNFVKKIFVKT